MKKQDKKTTKLKLRKSTVAKLSLLNMNMIRGGGGEGDITIFTKVNTGKAE